MREGSGERVAGAWGAVNLIPEQIVDTISALPDQPNLHRDSGGRKAGQGGQEVERQQRYSSGFSQNLTTTKKLQGRAFSILVKPLLEVIV